MSRYINPVPQYLDDSAAPLVNGKLFFFEPGTVIPKDTFKDPGFTIPNTNPVLLDAAGRPEFNIFLNGSYSTTLTDDTGQEWQVDSVGEIVDAQWSDWDSNKSYDATDIVRGSDLNYYESTTNNNLNNNPTSTSVWTKVDLGSYSGTDPGEGTDLIGVVGQPGETVSDYLGKVTLDDTTTGVLNDKITAGTNLVKTTLSPGGNESLELKLADIPLLPPRPANDNLGGAIQFEAAVDTVSGFNAQIDLNSLIGVRDTIRFFESGGSFPGASLVLTGAPATGTNEILTEANINPLGFFGRNAVALTKPGAQAIADSVGTFITWGTEIYDDGGYNTGTSTQIIIPSGVSVVRFVVRSEWDASTFSGMRSIELIKNSSSLAPKVLDRSPLPLSGQVTTNLLVSEDLDVIQGDIFEVQAFQITDGNPKNVSTDSVFYMEVVE